MVVHVSLFDQLCRSSHHFNLINMRTLFGVGRRYICFPLPSFAFAFAFALPPVDPGCHWLIQLLIFAFGKSLVIASFLVAYIHIYTVIHSSCCQDITPSFPLLFALRYAPSLWRNLTPNAAGAGTATEAGMGPPHQPLLPLLLLLRLPPQLPLAPLAPRQLARAVPSPARDSSIIPIIHLRWLRTMPPISHSLWTGRTQPPPTVPVWALSSPCVRASLVSLYASATERSHADEACHEQSPARVRSQKARL